MCGQMLKASPHANQMMFLLDTAGERPYDRMIDYPAVAHELNGRIQSVV